MTTAAKMCLETCRALMAPLDPADRAEVLKELAQYAVGVERFACLRVVAEAACSCPESPCHHDDIKAVILERIKARP